jgi:tetratricopeptide (TPR) repeat protein
MNMATSFTATRATPRMDFFNLGSTLLKQGRHRDAVPPLQRALILDPNFTDAHIALGDCYSALGLRPEAITEFQRAGLEAESEMRLLDAERAFDEAQRQAQAGDYPKALETYRQGLQQTPNPPAYVLFNIAYLSLLTADTTKALEFLGEAAKADPQEERVPFLRGMIHEDRGQWQPALELFQKSMKLNDDFHLARAHAALMQLNLGNRLEAGKLIEPLVGKVITDAELAALVQDVAKQVGF